jgi:BirA family biotin operon repressor/biotin-[acetyl-CoA-carboxylase] ligase
LTSSPFSAPPPDLADALARARPRLGVVARDCHYYASVGSTNDAAAEICGRASVSGARVEGLLVIADAQTAGRGRRGHTWFSPPGSGLYASVVLIPSRARVDPARAAQLLTLAMGVALAEGIEAATGLGPAVKWPNDLYVGSRKLGGILAEAADATVVVGYGINVGPMAYPRDLEDRATSLETELGRPVDRFHVLVETLAALAARYADLLDGRFDAILDAWRRRAPGAAGTRVSWVDAAGPHSGMTAGIDPSGALLVRTDDGLQRIVSGELTW